MVDRVAVIERSMDSAPVEEQHALVENVLVLIPPHYGVVRSAGARSKQ